MRKIMKTGKKLKVYLKSSGGAISIEYIVVMVVVVAVVAVVIKPQLTAVATSIFNAISTWITETIVPDLTS